MRTSRQQTLFSLIDSLEGTVTWEGGVNDEVINQAEQELGVRFPDDFRAYLRRYGFLAGPAGEFFGLSTDPEHACSVIYAARMAQRVCLDFPNHFVPIEFLGHGEIACIVCSQRSSEKAAPVVLWDARKPANIQGLISLAPSFASYLQRRLSAQTWHDVGMQRLEYHVEHLAETHGYDHAGGGKLPRNHVWRPYRYCVQDVVFGTTVVRQNRDLNCLEVDVLLTAHIPEYGPDAGAEAMTAFLISEAYKCGGTMEIRFTPNVEGGRVPVAIRRLAEKLAVELSAAEQGILLPHEARELYVALTDFSPELREIIRRLQMTGKLSVERACYSVHHRVWTKPEIEAIIRGSRYPDRLLAGQALPEQRHLYWYDLQHACGAILGGLLDRRLVFREHTDESGVTYNLEDDARDLRVHFEPDAYAKVYQSSEGIPMPWLAGGTQDAVTIPPGDELIVLVRARYAIGMAQGLEGDLRQAAQMRETRRKNGAALHVGVLVPADFQELRQQRARFLGLAQQLQVAILVAPEFMVNVADGASQRLARSRVIRDE